MRYLVETNGLLNARDKFLQLLFQTNEIIIPFLSQIIFQWNLSLCVKTTSNDWEEKRHERGEKELRVLKGLEKIVWLI